MAWLSLHSNNSQYPNYKLKTCSAHTTYWYSNFIWLNWLLFLLLQTTIYVTERTLLRLFSVRDSKLLKSVWLSTPKLQPVCPLTHFTTQMMAMVYLAVGISSGPVDKYRFSVLTIKISAVMAQFRKSNVSPIKMQTLWQEAERIEIIKISNSKKRQKTVNQTWRWVQIFRHF